MPATPAELFACLDALGIAHSTVRHPPIFTVEDGRSWHDLIPGLHCKNLFLKDRDGQFWLVAMPADKRAKLGLLEKRVSAARLSFARPGALLDMLGVTPGSVSPFALLNDLNRKVEVILDDDLMKSEWVNFHPLDNSASTTLRATGLLAFIRSLGYGPHLVNCGEAA